VKRTLVFIGTIALLAGMAGARVAVAQDGSRVVATQDRSALVPLKLQLVVSRTLGEKKISSLPYSLWVTANETRRTTSVRMGVQVPVVSTRISGKEGDTAVIPSYNYRDVGTNIDCVAVSAGDGLFQVHITLNESSIQYDSKDAAARPVVPTSIAGLPAFRNYTSNFSILLKDGQTAQYSSATDPLSGEVLRVDVTLNVLK
jgi:hypothetical protein